MRASRLRLRPIGLARARARRPTVVSLNSHIELSVVPMDQAWYVPAAWWTSSQARLMTVSEYLKLALFLAGYH